MNKVILLNGCGSSGKTSIARSIQQLSPELWLTFGIDTLIDMMPHDQEKFENFLKFIPGKNEFGPTMKVETKPSGDNLFKLMPDLVRLFVDNGHNIIIDEVLFNDDHLRAYVEKLSSCRVYFIGVFCDLSVMQEREILRRDRAIGLSNAQMDVVHHGHRNYDLKVDTSKSSPFEVARRILDFINHTPFPSSFSSIS